MPTSGTMTTSLNWIRWMNQTKIHVPRTAQTKEKAAHPHRVEPGANSKASRMPNCAEEIVAPVVGETNLFMYHTSDRRRTMARLMAALPDMDTEMRRLANGTIAKLERMTDADFDGQRFDFTNE